MNEHKLFYNTDIYFCLALIWQTYFVKYTSEIQFSVDMYIYAYNLVRTYLFILDSYYQAIEVCKTKNTDRKKSFSFLGKGSLGLKSWRIWAGERTH